jgi:hypothetical protein
MEGELVIRGRRFAPIGESTIEHRVYTTGVLAEAGLLPLPDLQPGETTGDYGLRIYVELCKRKQYFPLLGALLVPAGSKSEGWTPELARETEAFIRPTVDPDEQRAVENAVLSALIAFFVQGISSYLTSLGSSERENAGDPGREQGTATETSASLSVH